MKPPDPCDAQQKLVNQLKEQLDALGSQSQEDPFLQGLIDLQGLIGTTQSMLKNAERRLASCRQHPPPPNAPFLVTFADPGCSGGITENYQDQPCSTVSKRVTAYAALGVLGLSLGGYALHEHRVTQNLAAQNEQVTASLNATRGQIHSLTATVNTLAAQPELQPAPAADTNIVHRTVSPRHRTEDARLKKLQSQHDAQGKAKAMEDSRSDLAARDGDLTGTRTRSIARTHDEIGLLQENGERNYYEFDIDKSKQFQQNGPLGIRLKKANIKHQYADVELLLDDRDLSQKHVNLYQPVMFYTPSTPQQVELVINSIGRDRIHGYVRISKHPQSELASMSNANTQTRVPMK
jgi:hypothetical protein